MADDRTRRGTEPIDRLSADWESIRQSLVQKLPGMRCPLTDSKLSVWDAGDDFTPIPRREWLLGNVFCKRFVSGLIASGGVGKTALRIAQALALATERPLTGEKVHRRCRVLLVTLEDDEHELRRRVRAAMRHHGVRPADIKGWLFLSAPMGKAGKLVVKHPDNKEPDVAGLYDELHNDILKLRPDVVILDPLVKAHGLDENDNNAMDSVVELLAGLAFACDIAVDFVHHTSKGTADPGNADRARGASAVVAGARLVYTLTSMSDSEAKTFGIPEQARRSFIRVDSAKVNVTPPLASARWFRIVGVQLENGEDVQTVEPWYPPNAWEGIDNAVLARVLDDLNAGQGDGRRYSAAPNAKERAAWLVVQRHVATASEAQCKQVIKNLIETRVLYQHTYHNKERGEKEKGLYVDPAKLTSPQGVRCGGMEGP